MKKTNLIVIVVLAVMFFGFSAFAKNAIYYKVAADDSRATVFAVLDNCDKNDEEAINGAFQALSTGEVDGNNSEVCFTGSRETVIKMINSEIDGAPTPMFGSDEEWLENAWYSGKDSIAYYYVDGPNELREKMALNRCTAEFFRN